MARTVARCPPPVLHWVLHDYCLNSCFFARDKMQKNRQVSKYSRFHVSSKSHSPPLNDSRFPSAVPLIIQVMWLVSRASKSSHLECLRDCQSGRRSCFSGQGSLLFCSNPVPYFNLRY